MWKVAFLKSGYIFVSTWGANSENFETCIFWVHWCQNCRIINTSSLNNEVFSEKALELQFICEICHKVIFSKFDCILRDNL